MRHRTILAAVALGAMIAPLAATAEPMDTWDYSIECVTDPYNPIREDGTRDPNGDPTPGTAEWDAREADHRACTDQRDTDRRYQPFANVGTAFYGTDMYRAPERHDGTRFHHQSFNALEIPSVPSTEIYTPCSSAPGDCPNLPAGLQRFEPPYPVVVTFHGVIAQKEHHRYTTQLLAEEGYLSIGVSGTGPGYATTGPNVQRAQSGDDILNWLASDESGIYGQIADLDRVAFIGHSQGGSVSLSYQGDPRVHAIIAWDIADQISEANTTQPVMFQRTDGGFATPTTHDDYPSGRFRARAGYERAKSKGLDIMNFTARATVHTDWNGYGVGLAGNRLGELLFNYYNLAWLDRHLKGKLVIADGEVVTQEGRSETAERAYRQSIASDAFDRLTARFFEDSADRHNISMGLYDPDAALEAGDLYAGNVPYEIAGLETRDRFSPYYQSVCSLSVPNYVGGSDGSPGSATTRTADTGLEGDMRFIGCPEQ